MSAPTYQLRSLTADRAGTRVLQIEQATIRAGRVTCVVGPNGSGKSTLLQTLAFLAKPSGGKLSFQGEPIDFDRDLTGLRRRATLVAQDPLLFNRSVRNNLRYGLNQCGVRDDGRIDDALDRVGLAGFAGRNALQLSGGERQRVAIARAVVLDADAVLLDEPTASVDSRTRTMVEEIVRHLASRGATVVLSTHDLSQARTVGGEILVLEKGRIVDSAGGDDESPISNR